MTSEAVGAIDFCRPGGWMWGARLRRTRTAGQKMRRYSAMLNSDIQTGR